MGALGSIAKLSISMSRKASAFEFGSCRSEIPILPCTLAAGTMSSNSDKKNYVLSAQSLFVEIFFLVNVSCIACLLFTILVIGAMAAF